MIRKKSKAQSIVEYLLVFGGIVLAVLYGAQKMAKQSRHTMDKGDAAMNKTNSLLDGAFNLTD